MIENILLTSWNTFLVKLNKPSSLHIDLFIDNEIKAIRQCRNDGDEVEYFIEEESEILGHEVIVRVYELGDYKINVTNAVDFNEFDTKYAYKGKDLGATYNHSFTSFKLWAPLAESVFLVINNNEFLMKRLPQGIFDLSLDGDFDGVPYEFKVFINGKYVTAIDPYGKSSLANGTKSVVINPEKTKMDMFDDELPVFNSYLDAIIYEANIRDMTIDDNTDIVNKGKFLGLCEKGRKTSGGNPAGFDYLQAFGFTHLQLMPVLDFETVDELNPKSSYNWGYDPMQFFTLEGSYSTNPNDGYARIKEFKRLVRDFHKSGIRINLDVVFNHVYNVKTNALNKITPNYFFRRDENNDFLNHSYCGNEFASERVMARKLLCDVITYLMEEFRVDGFRFDLMGLLDINTMLEIERIARAIKPDVMLYGEGWNMGSETMDGSEFATMENASLLKGYAFFNDRYRNIVRGQGGKAYLDKDGYLLGNKEYQDGFKFAYSGSSFDVTFPALFENVNQSINYVECHDNATLYDAIRCSTNISDIARVVKKINKTLLLSFGIPFIHAGQEIAQSKFKHHNTYNEGDKYNKFSYELLDKRMDMYKSMITYIALRKDIQIFRCENMDVIDKNVEFLDSNDIFHIRIKDIKDNNPVYHIFVNTSDRGKRFELDKEVDFYLPFGFRKQFEKHPSKVVEIAPLQTSIFIEK